MGQKSGPVKEPAEQVVKEIRRATRRQFSAEEKIRIVLSGLRGEDSIAELCRREGIVQNLYYRWSKEFLEAGKKRLAGDTARVATSDEVKELRREAGALKEVVAELTLENRLLKKSVTADGEPELAFDPPARIRAFSGLGLEGLSNDNGLTTNQNECLSMSQDISQITGLVVCGLSTCRRDPVSRLGGGERLCEAVSRDPDVEC